MPDSLVSIIIPTFNRAHLIGETLDSVLAQTYQNWECIVVDDGSTDDTDSVMADYMAKDSRFQYHHRPKDRLPGGNAARNYGFEISRGEYVQWFDSDDLMAPEKLLIQVVALSKSKLNYCVCQNLVFENDIGGNLKLRHPFIHCKTPFEDFIKSKIVWMTPSAIWKKAFLENLSYLFDEELKAAQEWEFQSRVLANDPNYLPLDNPLVYIRKHNHSISYGGDDSERMRHYFLARFKIYTNSEIKLSPEIKQYLQFYMLNHFRKFISRKDIKYAFKIYLMFIVKEKDFSGKFKTNAFLALASSLFFNRSHYFLNKIKTID